MAEFQDVMHHMARICAKYWPDHEEECSEDCPLYRTWCLNVDIDIPRMHRERQDMAKVEEAVMAWAAEHPELVYPTWEEWLITQGLIKVNPKGGVGWALPELFKPIPDELAQKLGIEPKEEEAREEYNNA